MNGTSFFYNHSGQWRYEKIDVRGLLSPLADKARYSGAMIDFNVRAERMGWLPSAPQLAANPLQVAKDAASAGVDAKAYVVKGLQDGTLRMACEDPDNPVNFPRNLFLWRSNLLGSSGKGHEYMLRYLMGAQSAVMGPDIAQAGTPLPEEVVWHERAPEGKLDLLTVLDFRMSTTCLYADVVLPTATWYEKNDLNTTDMHPYIHPLSAAVDPAWESKSDWEIYKAIAAQFSRLVVGHLGVEQDVVLHPILHDTPGEIAQPFEVADWKRGECDFVPGRTGPNIVVVERDYPNTFKATRPSVRYAQAWQRSKGVTWPMEITVDGLGAHNQR